jgi:hypothetical protein
VAAKKSKTVLRITSLISFSVTGGVAELQKIPCMPQLACLGERAFFDEVLQIARGCGARGLADRDVVLGRKASFEAVDALLEHAGDDPVLVLLEPTAEGLVEFRLDDEEINAFDSDEVYVSLDPADVDAASTAKAKLTFTNDRLWTDCVTVPGLAPDTRYFYKLWTNAACAIPLDLQGLARERTLLPYTPRER